MKKILITDDQAEVRELVEVTLSMENYAILQARSGAEAVEIARAEKPDLIIMDVMMPGVIDGFEATRLIKDSADTKDCKVIILSAKGQQIDRDKGKMSGADSYFVKPFSPLELIKKVEETLDI
jgi:DNA-binding response OmpR family regulator